MIFELLICYWLQLPLASIAVGFSQRNEDHIFFRALAQIDQKV